VQWEPQEECGADCHGARSSRHLQRTMSLVHFEIIPPGFTQFIMSLQDGTFESAPDPTCENDDAAKPTVGAETRLDIMKSWIRACNEHHGSPCIVSKADANAWPTWLIDTVDACIVEGSMADRYLTLSYVWGGVQTLQLTTSNKGRLRQRGSLARQEFTLPKTIRDALDVTQMLGERYIFVDQLCVVQDDQQHKMAEIQHMADIYESSCLTLVAASGETADFGLADCLDQWIHQSPSCIERSGMGPAYIPASKILTTCPWKDRGWYVVSHVSLGKEAPVLMASVFNLRTFQECRFAARILYFLDLAKADVEYRGKHDPRRISWGCHRAVRYDVLGTAGTAEAAPHKSLDDAGYRSSGPITWPDFKDFSTEIRDYGPRFFTHDSDVVPAFAGTSSSLARVFTGGILYGLPVLFFDVALLWESQLRATRRSIDATLLESVRPPSWSWMAWHQRARSLFWEDFSLGGNKGVIVSPLVQWHYTAAGGAQIKIESEPYRYKHFAQDSESTPPPGWSRTTWSSIRPNLRGKICYVTPCAPGHQFSFPIPLVNILDAVTIPMPTSNKISCRTERAYFFLGDFISEFPRKFPLIVDATGSNSGMMMTSRDAPEGMEIQQKVELIAVSTTVVGYAEWSDDLYDAMHCGPGHQEFYNVLWIEWTDGVAYRISVGMVSKTAWEAADRELIDVVLG
jgi:hypothetical protein